MESINIIASLIVASFIIFVIAFCIIFYSAHGKKRILLIVSVVLCCAAFVSFVSFLCVHNRLEKNINNEENKKLRNGKFLVQRLKFFYLDN